MTVQSLLTVVVGWSVTDDHSFANMCARKDGDTGPSVSCTPASSFNPPMVERGEEQLVSYILVPYFSHLPGSG